MGAPGLVKRTGAAGHTRGTRFAEHPRLRLRPIRRRRSSLVCAGWTGVVSVERRRRVCDASRWLRRQFSDQADHCVPIVGRSTHVSSTKAELGTALLQQQDTHMLLEKCKCWPHMCLSPNMRTRRVVARQPNQTFASGTRLHPLPTTVVLIIACRTGAPSVASL